MRHGAWGKTINTTAKQLKLVADPLLELPRAVKRIIALLLDISLCIITVWLAYYLRLGQFVSLRGAPTIGVIISVLLALPIFVIAGLYRQVFRYAGRAALLAITWSITAYGICYSAIITAYGIGGVPRTLGLIQPILLWFAIAGSRLIAGLLLRGTLLSTRQDGESVLIYGAGQSGLMLAGALRGRRTRLVGFLDDDPRLQGSMIDGTHVLDPAKVADHVQRLGVDAILLAMPSVSRQRRNTILERLRHANAAVRTLPDMEDLARGTVELSDVRELAIEDLLGRDIVAPDPQAVDAAVYGRTVLVTGAGGSIGSELCRQLLGSEPSILLLLDSSEFALYSIHQELERRCADRGSTTRLIPILCSVTEPNALREVFRVWTPELVYHAAAYKHVPLVEHNSIVGISNNVIGTATVATFAVEYSAHSMVLISTDKAVRPTNVMGASKRLAEQVMQAFANRGTPTTFSMVRFGNVLGSSGSVVPLFREQIRRGGPITLTHPDIIRYFMTIPEAAQLVLQAGAMAHGGEVFVLDMGEPVRIADLARRMAELCGMTIRDESHPDGDIEIKVVGMRPGEKLYEELLIGNSPEPTAHPRIMRAREHFVDWPELEGALAALREAMAANDIGTTRRLLAELVPEYAPSSPIVDWNARS
jgi:FlaA1/EpsC-like NDP-sugar epimerase